MSPTRATFSYERSLWSRGFDYVAGVDEAGCGCWAGPVFAAAVILKPSMRLDFVRDSKTLSEDQRHRLAHIIKQRAISFGIGTASAHEIDVLNIRKAAALAMQRAIEQLSPAPQHLLIDAFRLPLISLPQTNIVRGDAKVKSIAAASILAKTARDQHMQELDALYPGYGFAQHKGYGTRVHQAALQKLGTCVEHRQSYAPIRELKTTPEGIK
jgi:ribonuclease HII